MPDAPVETNVGPHGMGWISSYQARRDPDRPAITLNGVTVTRGEFDRHANRLARALEAEGIGQDDMVAVMVTEGVRIHEAAFALWKLGATPLPLSARLPDAELAGVLELARPRLVIGLEEGRVPGHRVLPPGFAPDASIPDAPFPGDRVATHYKAITSGGSTGRPKVIVDALPSRQDPDAPAPILKIAVDDVMLHPSPVYHNSAFAQIHLGLCWGAHVIKMDRFDPVEWLRLIERHRVRWAYMVPTMMHRIWGLPQEQRKAFDLSSLEVLIHMAAPCPPWLKRNFIAWLGPERVWEIYGSTEAIGGTLVSGQEYLDRPGTVGKPVGELAILDEDGERCAPGVVGEIYSRPANGVGSTYRYIGAEPKRRGDWETLGDMGMVDEDGYLYLADRRVDMIISGGANVYPAEIEFALEEHPAIQDSLVVGRPDPDLGSRPHALIELVAGAQAPTAAELETHLGTRLARYKLPYSFEYTEGPLRDPAGKLKRAAFREALRERLEAGAVFATIKGD